MVSISRGSDYLYFGFGILGLLLLFGLLSAIQIAVASTESLESRVAVSLSMKTPSATYYSSVPKEELFSSRLVTVLFSPNESNQEIGDISCSMNCVKR